MSWFCRYHLFMAIWWIYLNWKRGLCNGICYEISSHVSSSISKPYFLVIISTWNHSSQFWYYRRVTFSKYQQIKSLSEGVVLRGVFGGGMSLEEILWHNDMLASFSKFVGLQMIRCYKFSAKLNCTHFEFNWTC